MVPPTGLETKFNTDAQLQTFPFRHHRHIYLPWNKCSNK